MQPEDSPGDFLNGFGSNRSRSNFVNRNKEMMDHKNIRQCKADQARILEQFNTPYYSVLEFGAEKMLSWEQMSHMFLEVVSGSLIVNRWNEFVESLKESRAVDDNYSEPDTVTINKVDIIQKQLEALVAQMEKVKEESRRKSEELDQLRSTVHEGLQSNYHSHPNQIITVTHRSTSPQLSQDQVNDSSDYLIDYSKPAGYHRVVPAVTQSFPTNEPKEVRRRSIEPVPLRNDIHSYSTPTLPPTPPPRHSTQTRSIDSSRRSASMTKPPSPPPPPPSSTSNPAVNRRNILNGVTNDVDPIIKQQKSMLMEELKHNTNRRGVNSEGEKKEDKGGKTMTTRVSEHKDEESEITKQQRKLKLSLNDEIRMKMQARLKVMNESDSDDGGVNDMD